jgi:hypothetical protein
MPGRPKGGEDMLWAVLLMLWAVLLVAGVLVLIRVIRLMVVALAWGMGKYVVHVLIRRELRDLDGEYRRLCRASGRG